MFRRGFLAVHKQRQARRSSTVRLVPQLGGWLCGGAALLFAGCAPLTNSSGGDRTPPGAPEASAAASSAVPPCSPADVIGSARWQGATGSLAGGLRLVNIGSGPCTLPGSPAVQLVDTQGRALQVALRTAPDLCEKPRGAAGCQAQPAVVVQPSEQAFVRFVWQNWCGPTPSGPITLTATLSAQQSLVSVPILDADGTPSAVAPRCDEPGSPSTLTLGPLQ
jgi:hypothetical protein